MLNREALRRSILEGQDDPLAMFVKEGPKWSGLSTWQCQLCSYSTTKKEVQAVYRHIEQDHPDFLPMAAPEAQEETKRVVKSKLVAPNGGALFVEG